MELLVDFNRMDKAGLIPARIPAGHEGDLLALGTTVVATDGEGTACEARIEDRPLGSAGTYLLLHPIEGTWHEVAPHRGGLIRRFRDALSR